METTLYDYNITTEVSNDGCLAIVKKNGRVLKRFKKETAHMDCERFVRDLLLKEQYS